ncbi:MAG: MFS transporter [Nitriliruptoraceae bacterium]
MSIRAPLLTRPFRLVVVTTLTSFLAFGATLPVLPRYVVDELGRGAGAVGVVFAVHALAAVLVRPLIGRLGDALGRRVLIGGGGVLTALALFGHLAVDTFVLLLVLRALAGAGQAAVVVGTTTRALDLAPAGRYGEASSYTMVAVQLGFGLGPLGGELLLSRGSFAAVWLASGLGSLLVAGAATVMPAEPRSARTVVRGLLHPAAIVPGVVFGIGSLGFIGFLAFVPLYADHLGLTVVAPLFLLSSGTVAAVRLLGARLPDRFGAVTSASAALLLVIVGLATMASWATPAGLYASALLLAAGTAIFAPSMVLAAVEGVADGERAQVMATFTLFLDLASFIGPALLGVTAARGGFGATFGAAGLAGVVALVLLRRWLAPRSSAPRVAAAGSA